MSHHCPRCYSSAIVQIHFARKAGGTVGTVAGAVGGFAAASAGAETGAVAGAAFGPVGILVGGLTGAILGGLVGGVAGGTAGATLGHVIDENILDNYRCSNCGLVFGKRHEAVPPSPPPVIPKEEEIEPSAPVAADGVADRPRGMAGAVLRLLGGARHGSPR